MTYVDPGYRGVQEVRYGASANTLVCWPDIDGVTVDVTSPVISIYLPNEGSPESTPLISGASMTEDGTTHKLTYSLNASVTDTYILAEGYRGEVEFTYGGVTHYRTIVFDVVRQPIVNAIPINLNDLRRLHTAVDQALSSQSQSTDGAGRYIQTAWQDVLDYVRSRGHRPALVSPPETLRAMTLARAMQVLCMAYTRAPDDTWARLGAYYGEQYAEAKKTTVLKYAPADTLAHEDTRGWTQPDLLVGPDLADVGSIPAAWMIGRRRNGY